MQDAIIIFLTVLCTLLFIFLIIGILLVVFLVKNKGSFTKGKDGSSTESLMRMEQQRESTPDTSPTADPKPDANPTPDPTPDSTPNSTPDPTSEQPNPIADILVHVGKYLQNKAETELDLCVLEGLDTVVTRILNQEVENLTNDAYNCIEKVQSLLELAQRNIRQQRRPQRREVVASVVLAEKIERVEVDGSDSGITSIGLADREDIIEGVDGGAEQDDVEGEEFRKIARIYSNVTRWLNSCREYKRQNAIEAQNSTASSVEIT